MHDESTGRGAPWSWQNAVTSKLGPEASTATFPTVYGADVTMTTVGDPLVGRVLDGRYEITQRLARGGMATVYRAVDTRLTRTVAVKVMHVGLGDEAEFARKFDREARAAARLSHPNVVSVFDQGQDLEGPNTRPYIVMEYVPGQTLRDVLNREAPMTPSRALEIMEPVLVALAVAHDAGLVHRDVKPENVLISDRGRIKVADFGLAKAVSSQTNTATQGLLIGTVSYLPPELVMAGRADSRSDVYSAGVVLFELLTGRKPHTGDTPIQIAYAHVHRDVPPPSSGPTAGRDSAVRRCSGHSRHRSGCESAPTRCTSPVVPGPARSAGTGARSSRRSRTDARATHRPTAACRRQAKAARARRLRGDPAGTGTHGQRPGGVSTVGRVPHGDRRAAAGSRQTTARTVSRAVGCGARTPGSKASQGLAGLLAGGHAVGLGRSRRLVSD